MSTVLDPVQLFRQLRRPRIFSSISVLGDSS